VLLSFSVQDTGIGIPAERMDRLFKSFSQVDASTTRVYGGSGLGLAISRAIVRSMGGDIEVTSTVGVGSRFSFDLRLARSPEPEADLDGDGAGDTVDLSGRRALVVDDNDTNRRILRVQLETWGMSCTAVSSPRGALAVLAEGPRFDIAILDMHMPETDGAQLAEQIRLMPAGENLPLILLTSLATKPLSSDPGLFAGFHTKPIRSGALRTMLGQILAPRRPGTPIPTAGDGMAPATALRVLLAEDNVVNQMVAQRLLHNLGHFVDIAADGQEALDAVQKRDYDVVLMDIHMPNLDGLGATRAIRNLIPAPRQPQIIAMTASSLPEDRRAAHDAGMNGYLLKPVRIADLVESLHALPQLHAPRPPSMPALVPTTGPVDLGVLDQLITDMGASSADGRRTLIEAYLEQADAWLPELTTAAAGQDRERVRTITHTLGSSSALLGAQRLADLLAEAGRQTRLPDGDLVPAVAAATDEYRLVSMVLHANHDALSASSGSAGPSDAG
jgi:CheY-like chemotaxis protein